MSRSDTDNQDYVTVWSVSRTNHIVITMTWNTRDQDYEVFHVHRPKCTTYAAASELASVISQKYSLEIR